MKQIRPMDDSGKIIGLYERHASTYDHDRSRSLFEKAWLDRLIKLLPLRATVLDLGCGMGEPIANYLLQSGVNVLGIDSSASKNEQNKQQKPKTKKNAADLRQLDLGRRFDGLV